MLNSAWESGASEHPGPYFFYLRTKMILATWAAYFAYYNRNFRKFSTFDRIIVYVVRPDAPAARLAPSGGILGRVLPRAMACFARVL